MSELYTLDDLVSRDRLDAGHDKPAKLAVIGHPVAHSSSPRMHQPALDALGIDARYIKIDVPPGHVAEAFARMKALGFYGCNVTVPHKLDALVACTDVHPDARSLGAVNTVRFDETGTHGFNTDGPGFVRAVVEDFDFTLATFNVMIAGAGGGAGQAIATQCAIQGVPRLVLVNRTLEKLEPLVERLRALGPTTEVIALAFDDPRLIELSQESDLIVNTTSVGLKEGDGSPLPQDCLRAGLCVYDTIYQPAVTPLLAAADATGARIANGLSLLLHQGALAFQHWFPHTDPLPYMREALGMHAAKSN
ncbi:MAG TPA: shikimate dehydrogenase [Luteolibacter sp.]